MIWFYTFLLICGINIIYSERLPPDIPLCRSEDNQCIVKTANELITKFPNGRPDMNIPRIDPFFVGTLEVNIPGYAIDLKMKLNDIVVTGMSSLVVDQAVGFTKNPSTSKFEIYSTIPRFEIEGNYLANGRVLVLPFQGDGRFKNIIKNSKLAIRFKPKVYKKADGLTYLKMDKVKIHLEPENLQINLGNLFNGNKELSDIMNTLINDNWRELWQEFSPFAYTIAEKMFKNITSGLFERFNYEDIYLD